ncbi:hypothetical protein HMPREF0765_1485 [Sphingobacterium spiritivorum ATCC 33300]|uniref:Uncharacterized protein n=1 Tax=Sphingobacterium spiritivorum ATCC 33300 TaxID=525372 RepID=C2FVX9_SPHSI|nr:hypothetical protein HMPREF0765_1485 [Sphingobacterium spiritivorum ATCC 33300]
MLICFLTKEQAGQNWLERSIVCVKKCLFDIKKSIILNKNDDLLFIEYRAYA